MKSVLALGVLAAGCLITPATSWAQASAQIGGSILDASGAGVPDANIKVTQTATGAVRTVTSGSDGGYVLSNLPLGPYILEASKAGFNRSVQTGIVLQVDSNPTINVTMQIGSVSEQVTVEAGFAEVETRSTGIGQVVDNKRVLEMPLNGRNPIELVFLAGMANFPGNGSVNSVRNYPTVVVSVAGGQPNSVAYLLDGSVYQDPINNLALPLPFPDALQEFKVETSALQAQYGYHSGASVSGVTKSGTNQFHGSLFEFLRNGDLNARNAFAAARDTLKRNQFGGVIGGPIIRDKLFFFGGWQHTAQRSDPAQSTAFVPTPAMLAGDFSVVASTACQPKAITLAASQGFVSNRIAPAQLNSVGVNFAKTLPAATNECGRTLYGLVANLNENLPVWRVDWTKNDRHTLFARATYAHLNQGSTYDGVNPLSISQLAVSNFVWQYAFGSTYVFTPTLVNSLRLSASRTNVVKIDDEYKSWADFGSNYTPVGGPTLRTTISGGGNFTIGGGASVPGKSYSGPNPSISDDISWTHGSHQFGFGGNYYHQLMNYWSGLNAVGATTFNGTVTGLGLADLLTGQATSFTQGTRYGFYIRQDYYSLYGQDSWKVRRGLTINYGVRWEPYTSIYSKYGQIHHFLPENFLANVTSAVYKNAPAGVIFPGDSQYPCGNNYNCNQWGKFFPRIGIAWDPVGDGKMTIRAAYGLYGDRQHMFYPNRMSFGPPFGSNIALSNVNMSNPWANYQGGNPIPSLAAVAGIGYAGHDAPFPLTGTYVNFPVENFKSMYVNQWNLSIQRQVGDWLLTANYLGNSQIHLITSQGGNPAVFLGLGPCTLPSVNAAGVVSQQSFTTCSTTGNQNQRRLYYLQNPVQGRYFAGIGRGDDGGTQSYNGLYFSAQKRLNRGITMQTNYTWSHCIGDFFDQQTDSEGTSSIPGNRRAYRGNCTGTDLRHLFVLNMVANTPKFQQKVLRILASGWQVSPILQLRSSKFFTVTSGTDRALTAAPGQTANLLDPNNVYATNQTASQWMNPAAFALPALGTYGNLGYNNFKGPGSIQLNLALSRNFPIREGQTLQVRGEAFNLPNHLNLDVPVSNFNSNTFGQILSDVSGNNGQSPGNQRIIQLALKYSF